MRRGHSKATQGGLGAIGGGSHRGRLRQRGDGVSVKLPKNLRADGHMLRTFLGLQLQESLSQAALGVHALLQRAGRRANSERRPTLPRILPVSATADIVFTPIG